MFVNINVNVNINVQKVINWLKFFSSCMYYSIQLLSVLFCVRFIIALFIFLFLVVWGKTNTFCINLTSLQSLAETQHANWAIG